MVKADWIIAGAIPIVIAWLLWRVQALAVNQVLRGGMYRLLRHQRKTYAFVSWFGVLVHEISHAAILLIGGHGIRGIKVGVDAGHVAPRQVHKGPLGTLTFIAAALAPMVAVPAAVACLLVAGGRRLPEPVAEAGARPAWDNLRLVAIETPRGLLLDLVGMDVTTIAGAALLLLAVFAMPSARPSHVKTKGEPDEGDIAVVRRLVRKRPLPMVGFVALLYGSYFVAAQWGLRWYWLAWEAAWMVAVVGIVLAAVMGAVWYGVAWTGRIQAWLAWLPYAAAIAVQIGGRQTEAAMWLINLATVVVLLVLAGGLRAVATRRF